MSADAITRLIPRETVMDPADPMPGARLFISRHYESGCGTRTLHHQGGLFYAYNGAHYAEQEEQGIRARLWQFASEAKREVKGAFVPYQPNAAKVGNLLDATRAIAHLPADRTPACWLDERSGDPPAAELAPVGNGILHIPERRLYPPSPRLYTHHSFSVEYDPARRYEPKAWLQFLGELWPDDPETIGVLQEVFGYLLLPDTSQQKAFLLIGPPRSGKGTIARVLTRLLGQANVCSPTLSSLSGPFGLQPLLGKLLALISDARLGGRADQSAIAERLLTVSGEDSVTVERKHLTAWHGRLPTRFMILTNELPRLADSSGALASRFIVLTLNRSFYGQEDPTLTHRLFAELPGIFDWALTGWERLRERGYFIQPTSSREAIEEMADLGSPIAAFVRERCRVVPGAMVECSKLFAAWGSWCADNGRDHTSTVQTFGRDLKAAFPSIRKAQPREEGERVRVYEGIGLAA